MIEGIQSAEIKRVHFLFFFSWKMSAGRRKEAPRRLPRRCSGRWWGRARAPCVLYVFEEPRLDLWREQVRRCIIQGAGWETDVGTPRGRRTNNPPNMSCMYRMVPHVHRGGRGLQMNFTSAAPRATHTHLLISCLMMW